MFAKTFITAALALVSFAASTAAMANEDSARLFTSISVHSTLTRAEVSAEAHRARNAGEITQGEITADIKPVGMAKTRAQVRAETLEAIRLGAISQGEQSSFPTAAQLQLIEMAGLRTLHMTVAAR